jgi:hypothetical protein
MGRLASCDYVLPPHSCPHSAPKESSGMKLRVVSLSLFALCLTLAAIPAMAGNTLSESQPGSGRNLET